MKTSTETKRVDEKASHTALIAAIYRFLASKERRPGFTGPDDMADVLAEKDAIKKNQNLSMDLPWYLS
jgi:O-methyltransferase involved in polyketide biosynthesis